MVFGNSRYLACFPALANSIITRAFDVGADQAITELRRYTTRESFTVQQMCFIGGVTLSESFELALDIHLIPFTYWDEEQRRRVPSADDVHRTAMEQLTAALVKYHSHPRRHERPQDPLVPMTPGVWNFEELDDALRCLTLMGPCGPAIIGTSITPTDWLPIHAELAMGQIPAPTAIGEQKKLTKADLEHLQQIHHNFTNHSLEFKKRLRVPMGRLNQSMRRNWSVDSAIDLGIALETLFSDNKPYDSSIGFTLRVRAARVLRTGQEDRQTLAKLIGNLYDLR